MKRSADYNDYVFKNGKVVGKFDQMYKYSRETPWRQDKILDLYYGRIAINVIEAAFEKGNIKTVLEAGCGYGYLLSKIKRRKIQFSGFDISETAIKKAKKLHPDLTFFVDDLINLNHQKEYDLVICRELLWYVIYDLDTALSNLKRLTRKRGYLYVALSFPNLQKPFVGKRILPNPQKFLSLLEKDYKGEVVNFCQRLNFSKEGPIFYWLGRKR